MPSFIFLIFQKLFINSLSNCSLLYEDYFILLPKSREWRRDGGLTRNCECKTKRVWSAVVAESAAMEGTGMFGSAEWCVSFCTGTVGNGPHTN